MKTIITFALFLAGFTILSAQEEAKWIRNQVISPDGNTIAFTYKGNLYTVPTAGGDANQLTFHEAHDHHATWSPDGQKIAFSSNRYGNFDIFIMDAKGGQASRLTFHSGDETPYSFSPKGDKIYFSAVRQDLAAHRQHPSGSQSELYTVPTNGGRIDQVFTIPAEEIYIDAKNENIYYHDKKGGENEWRKHQVSAIARDLWQYNIANKKHTQLSTYGGEDRQPILSKDQSSLYFLSERSGNFNIHKMDLKKPKNISQITSFSLHPVRFLSQGNGILCFGFDGELYTMKEGREPLKVQVNIRTQNTSNSDKYISINGGVREMAVSPNGKEIAFISRGEVFVTSVEESFTKRLTNTAESERFVSWGPKGESVIYSSERDGKWSVFKTEKIRDEEPFFYASTLLKESALIVNNEDNYLAQYSPDGKKLAYIKGRRTLVVKDTKSGKEIKLLTPKELFHMRDGDKYFKWSPDSKWLLVGWSKTLSNSEVLLISADGKKRVNLTNSGYADRRPKWVNGGKQIIWTSNRNGLKSQATSGQSQYDIYTMFFDQEEWDKFNLSEEEYKLKKAIDAAKKKKEEAAKDEKKDKKKKRKKKKKEESATEKKDSTLSFDWERMEDWKSRLTIHSSSLGDAVLSKDGETLYYLTRFEGKTNLWSTNLRTKETKQSLRLNTYGGRLVWDKDMKNLYLLSAGRISKIDPKAGKKKAVKIKEEMMFDVEAERSAIFDHVWIRTNAIFYHPDFHGVDWDLMRKEYSKYLPSIGNSYELMEMLSEMLGELNVSHAGARYTGRRVSNPDATASLGIFMDYKHKRDGVRIEEIIKGGPLDKANIKVKAGMIIEKINGETILANRDVAQYLNRLANKYTLLEILDPASGKRKMVTIKPISLRAERRLLYKRWVKKNEEEVDKLSGGRLGYVHIPGMGDGPFRSIYQDMMGKYADREAMIIDTRFNGGGDLVADLAMFFTGVPFISYATEAKVVGGEPTSRWTKPTIAMINEAQYSDGHCFSEGYSDLKIGKTVGMPTPGTCSFAGWESLPDGNRWGVVPISAKDIDGNWMENLQTEPDVKVKNMPGIIDQGRDQQLEKTVEVMLSDLDSKK